MSGIEGTEIDQTYKLEMKYPISIGGPYGLFFKENLKIDEGADVDGYLKRLTDNKVKSETVTKQSASKKADKDTVKTEDKKAVNQN